jgi:hypothetical protein
MNLQNLILEQFSPETVLKELANGLRKKKLFGIQCGLLEHRGIIAHLLIRLRDLYIKTVFCANNIYSKNVPIKNQNMT